MYNIQNQRLKFEYNLLKIITFKSITVQIKIKYFQGSFSTNDDHYEEKVP